MNDGDVQHLAWGSADFAGEGFATIEAAREAWRVHGREVFAALQADAIAFTPSRPNEDAASSMWRSFVYTLEMPLVRAHPR